MSKKNVARFVGQEIADEEKLKSLLGADYETFVKFREGENLKAKRVKAKELANAMVSEGGKYYTEYTRLDQQLNAIWEKALEEARAEVGLVDEEEKPTAVKK